MSKVYYSYTSQAHFDTLDGRLKMVLLYIKDQLEIDHSVICGYRSKEDQDAAFNADPPTTTLEFPKSKHNALPSIAVDVVPWLKIPGRKGGIHWHDPDPKIREMYYREMVRFHAIFQMVAKLKFGLTTRWGGDWDRDWSLMDNKFNDYPHQELVL